MRFLIVSQYFWPETFCINELAASLVERGHSVEVLTGIPNYPRGRFFDGYGWFKRRKHVYLGVKIHRVPLIPRGRGGAFRLILNYLSFVLFSCLLGPFVCRGRYDVIFVYEPSPITVGLPALLLKKMRKTPVIFWVQDLWPESISATKAVSSPFILRWVEKLVRYIYNGCDHLLVQSKAFCEPIMRMGIDGKKIGYFPNCAGASFKPVDVEVDAEERGLLPKGFCVMFAGNIGVAQDFPTILAAAERLKAYSDIHIVVLGEGRMSGWVENEIERRGLGRTVHLLGKYPSETMPRFFSLADAMLVTLRKDPIFAMTVPAKVQSYLACGRPIIAALDGEGARILRESGAGVVCEAEQPEQLAEAVLGMYHKTDEERRCMGMRARSYCEANYDGGKLLGILEDIMMKLGIVNRLCLVGGSNK